MKPIFISLAIWSLVAQINSAARVPAQCPAPEEIAAFRDRLTGLLVTPDDPGYDNAGVMLMNYMYNSKFGFVLYATSQNDIIEYMKFITQFGLRPTVRSSGHDFIGRSAGNNTYHLSLQVYKEVSVNFNDAESSTGVSMTVTTGNTWGDLYKRADELRKIVLGGSAPTVAVGGYMQGGGHSPLTPKLGLGVDQVIRFTMVNVDAELMDVDKNGYSITRADGTVEYIADPEVFWAVMGGGGGTFGIVVNFKLKLHEPPENGFVHIFISWGLITAAENRIPEITDKISEVLLTKGDNWGGFMISSPTSLLPPLYNGSLFFSLLHWGGWDGAKDLVEDLVSWHPEWLPSQSVRNLSTFWEYQQDIVDPVGYRLTIATKFLQDDDLLSNDNLENVYQKTMEYKVNIGCTGVIIGGAAKIENPATSVSPDFRQGHMSLGCGAGWIDEKDDELHISQFNDFKQYHDQVGRGVYYNEPNYVVEDWKTAFWGSMENYDRLLAVKQNLDPDNVFWCHNCVGSDLIDYETPCPVTE